MYGWIDAPLCLAVAKNRSRVARPAVKQPVKATRRARGHLAAIDERYLQPSEREVVRERPSGTTAADDQDVRGRGGGHGSSTSRGATGFRCDPRPDTPKGGHLARPHSDAVPAEARRLLHMERA